MKAIPELSHAERCQLAPPLTVPSADSCTVQSISYCQQYLVARLVSEGVFDRHKFIEVDAQQSGLVDVTSGMFAGHGKVVVCHLFVGQSREWGVAGAPMSVRRQRCRSVTMDARSRWMCSAIATGVEGTRRRDQ